MPSEGKIFNVDHVLNNICIFILLYWQISTGSVAVFTLYDLWSHGVMLECEDGSYQDTAPPCPALIISSIVSRGGQGGTLISIWSYLLTPPATLADWLPTSSQIIDRLQQHLGTLVVVPGHHIFTCQTWLNNRPLSSQLSSTDKPISGWFWFLPPKPQIFFWPW